MATSLPNGMCYHSASSSPPVCSSALPVPAARLLLTQRLFLPSASPMLPCDSPLLSLLSTFQKSADLCLLPPPPLFLLTLWICNSFYSFMVVCSRALGGSRQKFTRGSSATFNQKFFRVCFHSETLEGNSF